jgi:hypothetical protein
VSAERFLNSYHNASTPPARLEGDFTEQDEANLVRLATLTSAARDGLAQLHLPEYQDKVGT